MSERTLPTQDEIDNGPHGGLGNIPSDYMPRQPQAETPLTNEQIDAVLGKQVWFDRKDVLRVIGALAHPPAEKDEQRYIGARLRRVCNLVGVPVPAGDDAFLASVSFTLLGQIATVLTHPPRLLMHPDDPALKLLPDSTTVVLQRNLPRTPV